MSEREDELMIAFQNGDDTALEQIYTLLKPSLYSFVYRYTRDEQLSIDIVQDSFVKLHRYKHHFDPSKGKLKSYLFQTAYRLMITKLNRRKKWQTFLPFLTPIVKEEVDHADRLTVRDAVARLPYKQRGVILLFYYHDMTYEDIAGILDIPKGTVKSRLHKAIQRLKDELGGEFHGSRSI